jgi:uracil-DNA glycosylase
VIWTAGILDGFADYEEREREFKLDPTKYLRNIAVVHLKKTFGGAESDMNVINAYAFRDRELLREQISLLRPNYIVACGQARSTYSVTNILIWLLGLEGLQNVDDPLGAPIYSEKGRFRVVPSMHPGYNRRVNRNRRVAYYKELCLMMGKIKDRLRLRYEERIEIKAGGA